jgi:hypothetical protein
VKNVRVSCDEALVLTLDHIGARYLAVQLASGWLSSLDYLHHTASLNLSQITPNADGTVTLVVAPKDPGVAPLRRLSGLLYHCNRGLPCGHCKALDR